MNAVALATLTALTALSLLAGPNPKGVLAAMFG
jgi:hypothetical protein